MRHIFTIPLLSLSLIAGACYAKLYKSVDEHGNVTYSDTPLDGNSQTQELQPINIAPPVEVQSRPRTSSNTTPAEEAINYQVRIVSPESGITVTPGQRNLHVALDIVPALRDGAKAILLMNGTKATTPSANTNLTIEEISRGEHSIIAIVENRRGQEVGRSESITVNVIRPTVR